MRRTLLICALVALGCAKTETPSADSGAGAMAGNMAGMTHTATIALADVAGTWEGGVMAAGNDTVVAISELTATADATGWSSKVANAKTPTKWTTIPATSVVAAGDSIVVQTGEFESVLRPGQKVSTHTIYRLQDGKLVATLHATYTASKETITLRSTMTRKVPK